MTADNKRKAGEEEPAALDETRIIGAREVPETRSGDSILGLDELEPQPKQLVLGEYVLLGPLGSGGMGQVFKAKYRRMDRLVAIKMLRPAALRDAATVSRFQREVRAAAQLFHPNIITAFDAGEQDGVHYLVMEYASGQALSQLVEQHGPMTPEKATRCILQAARGLEYAHSRGVVHRDIKPGNLMSSEDGTIKLLDLGMARFSDSSGVGDLTQTGMIVGTVSYMAPEQARNSSNVDHRADIYGLGCTFYFLLTGTPPFPGDLVQTIVAHANQPPPLLRATRQDVPQRLDDIVQKMLAKEAGQRYQSMGELIVELEDCGLPGLASALRAAPTSPATPAQGATGAAVATVPATQSRIAAIGIDVGTASSLIASLDAGGNPGTVPGVEKEPKTPSVVHIEGMNTSVGRRSLSTAGRPLDNAADDIIRSIGERLYPEQLDGTLYPPEVLLALILSKLAHDGRQKVGEFKHVVLAVPGSFNDIARKSIQDASYIAGLEVLGLVNTTMAAALWHAHQQKLLKPAAKGQKPEVFLVLSLGAGIFTASVIQRSGEQLTALASEGEAALGGRDFDQRLAAWVRQELAEKHKLQPAADGRNAKTLLRKCEAARQTLSTQEAATITFEVPGRSIAVEITRQQFQKLSGDLLDRIRAALVKVMQAAKLRWTALTRVLLVGGGTRMPVVHELISEFSGQLPLVPLPDDAVAQGAALYAGLEIARRQGKESPATISDVSFHSVGVAGIDPKTRQPANAILIPRNTRLPATAKRTFVIQKTGQDLSVKILQGEAPSPQECALIGKCVIENLADELPPGSPVNVEFHYSTSARLTIYVESPATGQRVTKEITRASGLKSIELQRWREWVETVSLCNNFF